MIIVHYSSSDVRIQGWNIEQMAEYFPLDQLSQIYLIDLCDPLLEVARRRFAARGLKNVQVLCQDAKEFQLPGLEDDQKVDLFTCSYSISMVSVERESGKYAGNTHTHSTSADSSLLRCIGSHQ